MYFPFRKFLVSPREIADRSGLASSSTVLELGPGSGFFSQHLARRLTQGRLDLLDIQFEMLRKARNKLHHFDKVRYVVGDAAQLPYAEASFDVVILVSVSVLGEISKPEACLAAIRNVLRPAGHVLCHESVPDPDFIRFRDLIELGRSCNLELEQRWGKPWNYTAVFRRGV